MNEFFDIVGGFFKDMFSYAVLAMLFENVIFSRALGSSTALFATRKQFPVWMFGGVMTAIITASSVLVYFINPLVKNMANRYYVTPVIYVAIIGIVYIGALLITARFARERRDSLLSIIHVSAFNCAVLGSLLLASNISDLSLGGYIGFGIGAGAGFTLATYFVRLAYEKLSGDSVPESFRGFPITLIYIGIVSLAIYGLIGHDLPF